MFRCCNKDCRQQIKGFRLTGQGINIKFVDKDNFEIIKHKEFIDFKTLKYLHSKHKMQCKECGHKDKASEFMKAYESPMALFDTDNLCTCGGEIWQDIEYKQTPMNEMKEEVWTDGSSQRKVVASVRNVIRCERCNKEYQPT